MILILVTLFRSATVADGQSDAMRVGATTYVLMHSTANVFVPCYTERPMPASVFECAMESLRERTSNGFSFDEKTVDCRIYSRCNGRYPNKTTDDFVFVKSRGIRLCRYNYTAVVKSCYRLNMAMSSGSQNTAQRGCREDTSHVTRPKTQKEFDRLLRALKERYGAYAHRSFRLGYLRRDGVWRRTNKNGTEVTIREMPSGSTDACAVLVANLSAVQAVPCDNSASLEHAPICEHTAVRGLKIKLMKTAPNDLYGCRQYYDTIGEACYRFVASKNIVVTRSYAQKRCAGYHGYLASPPDLKQLVSLLNELRSRYGDSGKLLNFWLGYKCEREDGSIFLIQNDGTILDWATKTDVTANPFWVNSPAAGIADETDENCVWTDETATSLRNRKCSVRRRGVHFICESAPAFWYEP